MSAAEVILLDALGTLLSMEPPAPALRRELQARHGVALDLADVERAVADEIAYYRAHNIEGRDSESLADLRKRCMEVLRAGLGSAADEVPTPDLLAAFLASLRFAPYEDVPGAIERMAARGTRLVVVSNWDCSLDDVLAATGLRPQLHAVVTSAQAGVAKPDAAIFVRALELAGATADRALHVGDSPHEDVEGARAAGIEPVLILRRAPPAAPATPPPPGVRTISTLAELPAGAA